MHFYIFGTRSFLDLDGGLFSQNTHHSSCMVSSRQWRMHRTHQELLQILQCFGTYLWLIHHSSIYTISQNKCLYTGRPCFIALHFFVLRRHSGFLFYFVLYKLKVCGNPASSKSIDNFPPVFVHFVPLCHILVILPMFQTFSLFYLFSVSTDH